MRRIRIKNPRIFTVSRDCKYHWSKLPRMIEIMKSSILDFSGANLIGANLSDANLFEANLSKANLFEADLSWANLSEADLFEADLCGSNLCDAIILDSKFNQVKIKDYLAIQRLGSVNRQTIIFKTETETMIRCGCFYGNIEQFRQRVKETHKDNQYAREYLAMLDFVKVRFERA